MAAKVQKITPNFWFADEAEEAVKFYTSIFKNSSIGKTSYYGEDVHGIKKGTVLTIAFELEGQHFTALNGGPVFKFNEAVSFIVNVDTQDELDYYWDKLAEGGDKNAQQCGWLKDKFGLSWQVVPTRLPELITDKDPNKSGRVMHALLKMKKLDIAELEAAYQGSVPA